MFQTEHTDTESGVEAVCGVIIPNLESSRSEEKTPAADTVSVGELVRAADAVSIADSTIDEEQTVTAQGELLTPTPRDGEAQGENIKSLILTGQYREILDKSRVDLCQLHCP